MARGAKLAVDDDKRGEFESSATRSATPRRRRSNAPVVIDCTPAGNKIKAQYYETSRAQGLHGPGQRVRVRQAVRPRHQRRGPGARRDASCRSSRATPTTSPCCSRPSATTATARIACTGDLRLHAPGQRHLPGDRFIPAPQVGKHDDPEFGTHHARDAHHVFETLGKNLNLFSSAVKLNTQYMHSIWFNLDRPAT